MAEYGVLCAHAYDYSPKISRCYKEVKPGFGAFCCNEHRKKGLELLGEVRVRELGDVVGAITTTDQATVYNVKRTDDFKAVFGYSRALRASKDSKITADVSLCADGVAVVVETDRMAKARVYDFMSKARDLDGVVDGVISVTEKKLLVLDVGDGFNLTDLTAALGNMGAKVVVRDMFPIAPPEVAELAERLEVVDLDGVAAEPAPKKKGKGKGRGKVVKEKVKEIEEARVVHVDPRLSREREMELREAGIYFDADLKDY